MPEDTFSNDSSEGLSVNDVVDLLGESNESETPEDKSTEGKDTENTKDKVDDESTDSESEEIKIAESEEEEEEEVKTTDEELVVPARRKEILKKYPNLFKEFPYLEHAYYRNQKYTEVFPTVNDAKAAAQKSEMFDAVENDVMSGNIEKIIAATKQNEESFKSLVDNYLDTLGKVDSNAQLHVIGNVLRRAIINMNQAAQESQNEALGQAAQILSQFFFNTAQVQPPKPLAQPKNTEAETKLQQERQQFMTQRFESARTDLQTRVGNRIKATIDNHIDPKNVMTEYVKNNAVKDAAEYLEVVMSQDQAFRNVYDNLWRNAFKSGFNQRDMDRLMSAWLSKAKSVLPDVISKARNNALKGLGKRSASEDKDRRGPVPIGRAATGSSSTKTNTVPKGMKTLDFLNQD